MKLFLTLLIVSAGSVITGKMPRVCMRIVWYAIKRVERLRLRLRFRKNNEIIIQWLLDIGYSSNPCDYGTILYKIN